jgi:glutamate-1-semialdehyde 2,1-aminomutase
MVNSGTEAVMSAIRLARGFTGSDIVIKFAGCYHGHVDGLLIAAGSGPATFGHPTTPGVPEGYAKNTLVVPYNDLDAVQAAVDAHADNLACIILEPVAGNMGVVPPADGFLEGLRKLCDAAGALLIFDEVITGFRVGLGGAQQLYGVTPDLTTLGKILGGGFPVGAFGGRAEIMNQLSPDGAVYQAGTLSGNPIAMAAGLATLTQLTKPGVYERLWDTADRLARMVAQAARDAGITVTTTRVGSMMGLFFADGPIRNFDDVSKCDTPLFAKYFHALLKHGVYIAPSQFEAGFVSTAHGEDVIDETARCVREALAEVSEGRR